MTEVKPAICDTWICDKKPDIPNARGMYAVPVVGGALLLGILLFIFRTSLVKCYHWIISKRRRERQEEAQILLSDLDNDRPILREDTRQEEDTVHFADLHFAAPTEDQPGVQQPGDQQPGVQQPGVQQSVPNPKRKQRLRALFRKR